MNQDPQLESLLSQDFQPAYASFFKRLLAWLIDAVPFILLAFAFNYTLHTWIIKSEYGSYVGTIGYSLAFAIQQLWYVPAMESRSGTLGKRMLRLRTSQLTTDTPPSYGRAFKRAMIASWPLVVGVLINVPMILYAKSYTTQADAEHFSKWMKNDESSASGTDFMKERRERQQSNELAQLEEEHAYKEPKLTGYFLMAMFVVFAGMGTVAAVASKRKQTWGDAYTDVVVTSHAKRRR